MVDPTPDAVEEAQPVAPVDIITPFSDDDFRLITTLVFTTHSSAQQKEVQTFLQAAGIETWAVLSGIAGNKLVTAETLSETPELSKFSRNV